MMSKINSRVLGLLFALLSFTGAQAQLVVVPNQSAATLANSLVGVNAGVVVTNATLTCPGPANGTFASGVTPLGISNGIILSSGNAASAASPATVFASDNLGAAGDANLTAIAGVATHDACILQFDFVSAGTSVNFDYQFASEEYPQYSCTSYTDAFGFFITGPGYTGATNIALLPGTTTPVNINTTTALGTCNPVHPYYINHQGANTPPVYDGLTSVLTAHANVTPGASYHLKLGVADGTDFIYNSGVFLKQGSLTIGAPVIAGCPSDITTCNPIVNYTPPTATSPGLTVTTTSNHNPGDSFAVGTTQVTYTFSNGFVQSTCTFNVTVNGAPAFTACPGNITAGTDNNSCSGTVSYNASASGTPAATYTYMYSGATTGSGNGTGSGAAFNIGVTNVTVTAANACGSAACNFTVTVNDTQNPVITCPAAATVNCQDATGTAALGSATATDNCGAPNITYTDASTQNMNINSAGNYNYTITRTWTATDGNGNTSSCNQVITVQDVTGPVISCPAPVAQCNNLSGNSRTLTVQASDNCSPLTTTWAITGATTGSGTGATMTSNFNVGTSTVTWTVKDASNNTSTCTTTVTVYQLPSVTLSGTNPSCYGQCNGSITTMVTGGLSPYTYAWNPGGATTPNRSGLCAGTYSVTVTDGRGCQRSASTALTQPAALVAGPITASPTYTVTTCNAYTIYMGYGGQTVNLSVSPTGGTAPYSYTWTPSTGVSNTHTASTSVSPTTTTTYTVTVTDARGCVSTSSFTVNVIDVRCGNKNDKVAVCHNGNVICVSPNAVPAHIAHGDCLGDCNNTTANKGGITNHANHNDAANITVYPNPSNSKVSIELKENGNIYRAYQITDINGRVVAMQQLAAGVHQDVITIDVSNYPAGIYIIRAVTNDGTLQTKFTVE